MSFCSPFDEQLATHGPPALFLLDRHGQLRFDATWTRDAWSRAPDTLPPGWTWLLLRDHGTGFVQLVLSTSPALVTDWPRADVRAFATREEAVAARAAYGSPPVSTEAW